MTNQFTKEQLEGMSDVELKALRSKLVEERDALVAQEQPQQGGFLSGLRNKAREFRDADGGVKGAVMGGLRGLTDVILDDPEGKDKTDLKTFEEKERIKRRVEQEFDTTGDKTAELAPEMEVRMAALARKVGGVRGMKALIPKIRQAVANGQTIDEIEDSIRIGSQSPEFTGAIRSAAQSVLQNAPERTFQRTLDTIDDEITLGRPGKAKDLIKRTARNLAGVAESKTVLGKERTVEFLQEIQDELTSLADAGVNTNIFVGTAEEVNAKIGMVNDPRLRKVATKIQTAIQNYRKALSGVAFSVPEAEEYKAMFPSIGRTAAFNSANIQALQEVMTGDVDFFYSNAMGAENYQDLFADELEARESLGQPTGTDLSNVSDEELERIAGGR